MADGLSGSHYWAADPLAKTLRLTQRDVNPLSSRRGRYQSRCRGFRDDDDLYLNARRPMSRVRSPNRLLLDAALGDRDQNLIVRPRSAPGDRRMIERQADKVIDMADDMRREAERLKWMAY